MSDVIRAYVNGRGVDVPAGAIALDAVRVADAQAADQVEAGDRALTDSRGLPLDPSAPLTTTGSFAVPNHHGTPGSASVG